MANAKERNAESLTARFNLSPEDLADIPEFDGGKVLVHAKWKAARFRGLLGVNREDAEDLIQNFLFKVWEKRGEYNPTLASRTTFAEQLIEGESLNANRRIAKRRFHEAESLDVKLEGGKPGSREITRADVTPEDSSLMPANYRGARRIRTNADLSFIRELMGGGIDWRIFSLRWKYAISDEELARELGWTIGKLRWHLKGYEKRYARLLGVKRPNGSDRPFGRYTKVR